MDEMFCPGCGEAMSKVKRGAKSGFECYACGAYSVTFTEVEFKRERKLYKAEMLTKELGGE